VSRICPVILLTVCLFLASTPVSAGQAPRSLFSHGSGPVEVLIFTDYFCPPCQAVEPYLDDALVKLHQMGASITFVDMPIYALTPVFSRYFLYAANASSSFADILRIRQVLFDIAKAKTVHSEADLIQALRQNQIPLALLDVKPLFDQWVALINRFEVKSTPTCVVTRPDQEMTRYSGGRSIATGVDALVAELETNRLDSKE
jgi:thiol-disulfide isomerase/thioredoxin